MILDLSVITSRQSSTGSLYVSVKNKDDGTGNGKYNVKVVSDELAVSNVSQLLEIENGEILQWMRQSQPLPDGKKCFQIEYWNGDKMTTQSLHYDEGNQLVITSREKQNSKREYSQIVARFKCSGDYPTTSQIVTTLHDYLYKIRIFTFMKDITFSVAICGMKYKTNFTENPEEFIAPQAREILSHKSFSTNTDNAVPISSDKTQLHFPEHSNWLDEMTLTISVRVLEKSEHTGIKNIKKLFFMFHGPNGVPLLEESSTKNLKLEEMFSWTDIGVHVMETTNKQPGGHKFADVALHTHGINNSLPHSTIVTFFFDFPEKKRMSNTQKYYILQHMRLHLGDILQHNQTTVQTTLFRTIQQSISKSQFAKATTVKGPTVSEAAILLTASSIQDILTRSTNVFFRETCFRMLTVRNSHEVRKVLEGRLQQILTQGFDSPPAIGKRKLDKENTQRDVNGSNSKVPNAVYTSYSSD